MKLLLAALTAALLVTGSASAAEESDPHAPLKALVGRINEKLSTGPKTAEDLAPELEEFDKLVAGFGEDEKEAAAQATLMQGMLYIQVLGDNAKGTEIIESLKAKYPGTKEAEAADQILASLKQEAEAAKVRASLVDGAAFPAFEGTTLAGKPISLADYKGKVVLVDFWATWCGPCVAELPNLLSTYDAYHDKGFEIVGISLDRQKEDLEKFVAEKKVTWPQVFEQGAELAQKYGVRAIPTTYLLDREGNILASGLRGNALEETVRKAVGED
jgi:Thiol-disulfide isomerase and thioredoxins